MSYFQAHEMKLIRRQHKVIFQDGVYAGSLLNDLRQVPPGAILKEIANDEDDGTTTLLFVEELCDK